MKTLAYLFGMLCPGLALALEEEPERVGAFIEAGMGWAWSPFKASDTYVKGPLPQLNLQGGGQLIGSNQVAHRTDRNGFLGSLSTGYSFGSSTSPWMTGFLVGASMGQLVGKTAYSVTIDKGGGNSKPDFEYAQTKSRWRGYAGLRAGYWCGPVLFFGKAGWTAMRLHMGVDPRRSHTWYKPTVAWAQGVFLGGGAETFVTPTCMVGISAEVNMFRRRKCVAYGVPDRSSFVLTYVNPQFWATFLTVKLIFPERERK